MLMWQQWSVILSHVSLEIGRVLIFINCLRIWDQLPIRRVGPIPNIRWLICAFLCNVSVLSMFLTFPTKNVMQLSYRTDKWIPCYMILYVLNNGKNLPRISATDIDRHLVPTENSIKEEFSRAPFKCEMTDELAFQNSFHKARIYVLYGAYWAAAGGVNNKPSSGEFKHVILNLIHCLEVVDVHNLMSTQNAHTLSFCTDHHDHKLIVSLNPLKFTNLSSFTTLFPYKYPHPLNLHVVTESSSVISTA